MPWIDTLQIVWKPFANFIIAGPPGTLVLRPSASLPFRHILARPERLHAGAVAHGLQIPLRESAERARDLPIRFHQKQRRNVGDAERVAGRIAILRLVEQGGKRYAEALVESFGRVYVVLRYSYNLDRRSGRQ